MLRLLLKDEDFQTWQQLRASHRQAPRQIEESMNYSHRGPYDIPTRPFFPHRRNSDGSLTSICLTCCATVASHERRKNLLNLIRNTSVKPQWSLSAALRHL